MNLAEGTELKKAGGTVRIKITKLTGFNSSQAIVIEGDSASVAKGDLFLVDRWVVPESAVLRVFVGQALSRSKLEQVAAAFDAAAAKAGVGSTEDPVQQLPAAVMSWSGSSWVLEESSPATRMDLGSDPSARAITDALRKVKSGSVYLLLPPLAEMGIALGEASRNPAVVVESDVAKAHYALYGRIVKRQLSYAWALPGITEADLQKRSAPVAMPLRTDWIAVDDTPDSMSLAGRMLTDNALRLGRVRSWLQLQSPPADVRFPYRLAVKEITSGRTAQNGDMREGERYKLYLEADPEKINQIQEAGDVPKRWVYVFGLDSRGKGTLIFPVKGQGNVGNRMPVLAPGAEKAPVSIALTRETSDMEIAPPFGVDTLLMLVSAEALPKPEILDFEGVRQADRGGDGRDPLTRLLNGTGAGTRGLKPPVPVNWSVERQTFRSRPK